MVVLAIQKFQKQKICKCLQFVDIGKDALNIRITRYEITLELMRNSV